MPSSAPGTRFSRGCIFGSSTISAVSAPIASAWKLVRPTRSAVAITTSTVRVAPASWIDTPSTLCTWLTAISTPAPAVKPTTTELAT